MTENEDFTIPNDIVTFAPEETTQDLSITILPDSMLEDPETIELILFPLGGPVGVDLTQVAVVTIQDEDGKRIDVVWISIVDTCHAYSKLTNQIAVNDVAKLQCNLLRGWEI